MKNKNNKMKKFGVMDAILFVGIVALVFFTIEMINTFRLIGAVPDTLIVSVFGAVVGEFGIMGVIKNTKEKQRKRLEDLEDRQHMEEREDKIRREQEGYYGVHTKNVPPDGGQ